MSFSEMFSLGEKRNKNRRCLTTPQGVRFPKGKPTADGMAGVYGRVPPEKPSARLDGPARASPMLFPIRMAER